jgi:hypothetical protein
MLFLEPEAGEDSEDSFVVRSDGIWTYPDWIGKRAAWSDSCQDRPNPEGEISSVSARQVEYWYTPISLERGYVCDTRLRQIWLVDGMTNFRKAVKYDWNDSALVIPLYAKSDGTCKVNADWHQPSMTKKF